MNHLSSTTVHHACHYSVHQCPSSSIRTIAISVSSQSQSRVCILRLLLSFVLYSFPAFSTNCHLKCVVSILCVFSLARSNHFCIIFVVIHCCFFFLAFPKTSSTVSFIDLVNFFVISWTSVISSNGTNFPPLFAHKSSLVA